MLPAASVCHFPDFFAETQSKRIRERYLAAILRQDIAYFDRVGAGEVTTRIQTDCRTCTLDERPE